MLLTRKLVSTAIKCNHQGESFHLKIVVDTCNENENTQYTTFITPEVIPVIALTKEQLKRDGLGGNKV